MQSLRCPINVSAKYPQHTIVVQSNWLHLSRNTLKTADYSLNNYVLCVRFAFSGCHCSPVEVTFVLFHSLHHMSSYVSRKSVFLVVVNLLAENHDVCKVICQPDRCKSKLYQRASLSVDVGRPYEYCILRKLSCEILQHVGSMVLLVGIGSFPRVALDMTLVKVRLTLKYNLNSDLDTTRTVYGLKANRSKWPWATASLRL